MFCQKVLAACRTNIPKRPKPFRLGFINECGKEPWRIVVIQVFAATKTRERKNPEIVSEFMGSPDYKSFHPKTRQAWRKWLEKNHAVSPGIWFIYYKKESGMSRVSYEEAVEEALCFGWIDSLPRKLDDKRSMLKFTPRKPKSSWSKLNKTRVEKLGRLGLINPAGLAKIEQAKKDGSWDILTSSDYHTDNNSLPGDLAKAFLKNKKALANFSAFPPGYRKQFLFWIESAKMIATRKQRIRQTIAMAAANRKPGPKGFNL